jgi:hypothetical protein
MKTIESIQTVSLPCQFTEPSACGWSAVESKGNISLSDEAIIAIEDAFLTYLVAHQATLNSPDSNSVRRQIDSIACGVETLAETSNADALIGTIENILAGGPASLALEVLWSEAASVDLQTLLVQLYAGVDVSVQALDALRLDVEAVLDHVVMESSGKTSGPRRTVGAGSEFLAVVIPIYKEAGGKMSYYNDHMDGRNPESTNLVRFVAEICSQFVPEDWPYRRLVVPGESVWALRIKHVLTKRRRISRAQ